MNNEIEINGWTITTCDNTIYHTAEGWTAQVEETLEDAIRWAETHDADEE